MASIVGLLVWRIYELGRLRTGAMAIFLKALERNPVFVGLMLIGTVALWALNVWDAYEQARPDHRRGTGVFALILVLFFALGWQIGEIDMGKAIRELPDAWPPLSRVLWPWAAAVTRDTESISAGADVLVPCDDEPPPPIPEEIPSEPYLMVDPTCGDLSQVDSQLQTTPGTPITVTVRGFPPNTPTDLYWVDPLNNEFRMREGGEYIIVTTDAEGGFEVDLTMPYRLTPPSAEGRQFHRVEARQTSEVGPLMASEPLRLTAARMIETIFLGMMATFFGILFSVPVSFLAARNLMSASPFTLIIYYLTRFFLNVIRSIEPLIWALIAVVWVGLGPFAGIIALTIHSIAALGKLYSESIEGIDPGPIEAIRATGATGLQTIMFAVIPQMIPPFVSFSIYRWDINVRMSTIIGLVGGGGIGFLLVQYIRLLDYRAAGIAVWFIAITVAILDYVSAEIRQRFV
jgi:phosphonate transport system permease protein